MNQRRKRLRFVHILAYKRYWDIVSEYRWKFNDTSKILNDNWANGLKMTFKD
jgi:hypothetical protein